MLQDQHGHALQLYMSVNKRFYGDIDAELLLYEAKTSFDSGKWRDCIVACEKAMMLEPGRLDIVFDVAHACQRSAMDLLKQQPTIVTSVQATNAIEQLKHAIKLFSWLDSIAPGPHRGPGSRRLHAQHYQHSIDGFKSPLDRINKDYCAKHAAFCKERLPNLEKLLVTVQDREATAARQQQVSTALI